MNPADLNTTLETLKLIARLEAAMAEFYKTCASLQAEDQQFWLGLEQDELHHVQNVGKMADLLAQRQARFERGRSFNATAVQTFISYVETAIHRLKSRQVSRDDLIRLLSTARDMEQSIIESKYSEIVKTDDVEWQSMMRQMLADTAAHKNKVVAKLATLTKGK